MELSASFTITLVSSIIASGVQLTVFVVLYKTLKAVHKQNTNHEKSFKIQLITQKNLLTFKFADWLSSEIKYFSPAYKNNKDRDYILTPDEINNHLMSMGSKMISLCNDGIVDVNILKDEIDRLIRTFQDMETIPTEIIVELRKLL